MKKELLPVEAGVDVAADGSGSALGSIHGTIFLIIPLHIGALLSELVPGQRSKALSLRASYPSHDDPAEGRPLSRRAP